MTRNILFLLLFLLPAALAGAQTTLYVDAVQGSDTNAGTSPAAPLKTIGRGLTLVTTGGTVRVAAGAYPESLTLTRRATIAGAGGELTRITGTSGVLLQVQAGGMVLQDLGLEMAGSASGDACLSLGSAAANTRLSGLICRGGRHGLEAAGVAGIELADCLFGCGGQRHGLVVTGDCDDWRIRSCTFADLAGTAITADAGAGAVLDGWTVAGCTFLNGRAPTVQPGACLEIPRAADLAVTGNDFSGFLAVAILCANPARATAGTEPPPAGITIRGNHFHHGRGGCTLATRGVITVNHGVDGLCISENTIDGIHDASGILLQLAPASTWQSLAGVRITGNAIRGLTGRYSSSAPTNADADAVTLEGLSPGGWDGEGLIRFNVFENNAGAGASNLAAGAPAVDARWNWWGAAGGPAATGGDGVKGNVDAADHLARPRLLGTRRRAVGTGPAAVVAAELGGTTGPDLATADYNAGTVSICLSRAGGGFAPAATVTVGNTPGCLAAGDFDGDGDRDLAVGNLNDGTVSILTNNAGSFSLGSTLACGSPLCSLAAGRIDGDNRADLVVALSRTPFVAGRLLLYGGAAGTPTTLGGGTQPADLALADMDSDGDLDLVLAEIGATAGIYLYDNQAGTLASPRGPIAYGVTNPLEVSFTVAEINGDSHLDLALGITPMVALPLPPSEVRLMLGQAGLNLAAPTRVHQSQGFLRLAAGDLEGNGRSDLAVLDMAAMRVTVLQDHGTGGFTGTTPLSCTARPRALTMLDRDGDGRDEVAIAAFGTDDLTLAWLRDPAARTYFGLACPGAAGAPAITLTGEPRLGSNLTADLAAAAANAPALLLISPGKAGCLDLGGCRLLVDPALFLALPALTGKGGKASLPLNVPAATDNLDLRLYLQWIIADGRGRLGPGIFALSGGAALRIGW